MQQTTENNSYREETIDLKDIINQSIASKKLIIIITLLSTILAFYYSSTKPSTFTSKALIEIGHHNVMNINESEERPKYLKIIEGKKILIESATNLVRELNISFAHKKQDGINNGALSFSIIEDRLIEIKTTSPSSEIAINSVNKITSYILDRHENIIIGNTQRNLNLTNTNIEQLNSEIAFHNERKKKLIENQVRMEMDLQEVIKAELIIKLTNTEKRIIEIEQLLPTIDKKIILLQNVIQEDTENLRLLETDLELLKERAAIPPTLNEVIYLYKNRILDFESEKNNLESELIILQASLSDIKIILENKNEDSAVFSKESLSSKLTDKQIYLNDSIYRLNDKIFKLLQEKNVQEKNLKSLMAQTSSNSVLVGEITSVQTNPNTKKFALQGFIFGAILSIVLVLIIGKFKALKEENVITL